MPTNREGLLVIEGRALEATVVEKKAAWLDQIDLDPEAAGKTKQGPGILRDVRLVQGETQTSSKSGLSGREDRTVTISRLLARPPNSAAVCRIVRPHQPYSFRQRSVPDDRPPRDEVFAWPMSRSRTLVRRMPERPGATSCC